MARVHLLFLFGTLGVAAWAATIAIPDPSAAPEHIATPVPSVGCGEYNPPCGSNAHCNTEGEYPGCVCNEGFYGAPFAGCMDTPECLDNSQCADNLSCDLSNQCTNPCLMRCMDVGCVVTNHTAECVYSGRSPWW